MNRDLLKYIKVTHGIYLISILIWMIFWFCSFESFDLRTFIIVSLSLVSIQLIILFCSIIFYFVTKNNLDIEDQIKYGLIILIATLDILYLTNLHGSDGSILIFLFFINTFSILYILKKFS